MGYLDRRPKTRWASTRTITDSTRPQRSTNQRSTRSALVNLKCDKRKPQHYVAPRFIWTRSREEEKIYLAGVEPRERSQKASRCARIAGRRSGAIVAPTDQPVAPRCPPGVGIGAAHSPLAWLPLIYR